MRHPNGSSRTQVGPPRPRGSSWVGAVLLLAVVAGCTQHVPGVPSPAPTTAPAPTAAPAPAPADPASAVPAGSPTAVAPAADVEPQCQVSIATGRVRMSGGGRVRTVNGGTQFACRTGPLVVVESVEAGGVRMRVDGASVLVASGATGQVGPYRISVRQLDPPAAELAVAGVG